VTASPRWPEGQSLSMGYATKRETVLLFFWKNQILSRLELGHVDLSEQANVLLVLKDWP